MSETRGPAFALTISLVMVVTGSLNTIFAKWADSRHVDGVAFNHPFLQGTCMFIGEFLCLPVFFILYLQKKLKWKGASNSEDSDADAGITLINPPRLPQFSPLIFLFPTFCDILSTWLMYTGLNLTTASSYQMLRGSVIVFTGLLSVCLLGAHIQLYRWMGMIVVIFGLIVVGVTDIIYNDDPHSDKSAIFTGIILVILAQVLVAIQMVYEQKYLNKYDVPPLFAVGLEGLFGTTILSLSMIPMYYIHVPRPFSTNPEGRLEDVFYAFEQIGKQPLIAVALSGLIVSIAFFNFAGVSVTKELSATTRMVLDSVRTLVIWMFSIPLFGEVVVPTKIFGFALLICGMLIYNDILITPFFRQKILSKMDRSSCCTKCLFSICGADRVEEDREDLLNENE